MRPRSKSCESDCRLLFCLNIVYLMAKKEVNKYIYLGFFFCYFGEITLKVIWGVPGYFLPPCCKIIPALPLHLCIYWSSYPATMPSNESALRLKGSLFPLTFPFALCSSGCFSKLSLAQAWISGSQNVSPGNRTPPGKGSSGRWSTTQKQNKPKYEGFISYIPLLYLQHCYRL